MWLASELLLACVTLCTLAVWYVLSNSMVNTLVTDLDIFYFWFGDSAYMEYLRAEPLVGL